MKKYSWLFLIIFTVVVLLPLFLHGDKLLVINNDTANHLAVFESIKRGNPHFLYWGQEVIGYSLVGLEQITGIRIPTLFMWFNFIILLIGGLTIAALVILITKSWLGGMLSAVVIVFLGATQHLFWSGTIFNIIEYLILLPVMLIAFFFASKKGTMKMALPVLAGIGVLMFFFHPSLGEGIKYILKPAINTEATIGPVNASLLFFGIINLALFIPCWIGIKSKEGKTEIRAKAVFGIITGLFLVMLLLGTLGLTSFSSRLIINAFILLGMALCICIGVAMNSKSRIVKGTIITMVTIGAIPSLINWFTWTSFYNPTRGAF